MLGHNQTDETDGKKSGSRSLLTSLGHELRKVIPRHRPRPKSNDSLEIHRRQKSREEKKTVKMDEANRDSAFSLEDSDCEVEVCTSSSFVKMTAGSDFSGDVGSSSSDRTLQISHMSIQTAAKCSPDSTKAPIDGTSVCIMSPRSRQGDGLLQVTNTCIGTYKGSPVYEVNFKGKLNDPSTYMVWYFQGHDDTCNDDMCAFIHMLDPTAKNMPSGSQSSIPLDRFVNRLCRFKKDDEYVLAVRKAPQATSPFGKDYDGLLHLTYHESKGGAITISLLDDMMVGTAEEGVVQLFKKSLWPGFCTNPYTLLNIYDDGYNKDRAEELKRSNGEV